MADCKQRLSSCNNQDSLPKRWNNGQLESKPTKMPSSSSSSFRSSRPVTPTIVRSTIGLFLIIMAFDSSILLKNEKTFGVFAVFANTSNTSITRTSRVAGEIRDSEAMAALPLLSNSTINNDDDGFYTNTRGDRHGMVILDMIFARAYAQHHNKRYLGACSIGIKNPKERESKHEEVIHALGLDGILRFQCPPDKDLSKIISHGYKNESYFTPEFLQDIRGIRDKRLGHEHSSDQAKVVVHIRRGDVNPCLKDINPCQKPPIIRYTPNQFYLDMLDKLIKNDTATSYQPNQVYIMSESHSTESFDDFSEYNQELDGSLRSAFLKMASAEVLIMAKSAFSYVAALLNNNTVYYTPFWYAPMDSWTTVDEDILNRSEQEYQRLRKNLCKEESPVDEEKLKLHCERMALYSKH